MPPVGHVAGLWARTDAERGVHRAPEGTLRGVLDAVEGVGDEEAGRPAKAGVNCVRPFTGEGLKVWGARTLSSEGDLAYVNVRRQICFLTDSIRRSTAWAVFEPNGHGLWSALRHSVTDFLDEQWRRGALAGATQEEAYRVVCDGTVNDERATGKGVVRMHISVAPARPAEFVTLEISQLVGQTR